MILIENPTLRDLGVLGVTETQINLDLCVTPTLIKLKIL